MHRSARRCGVAPPAAATRPPQGRPSTLHGPVRPRHGDGRAHGAIAQLGERLDRTQEVAGSSPASSIGRSPAQAGLLLFGGSAAGERSRRWVPRLGTTCRPCCRTRRHGEPFATTSERSSAVRSTRRSASCSSSHAGSTCRSRSSSATTRHCGANGGSGPVGTGRWHRFGWCHTLQQCIYSALLLRSQIGCVRSRADGRREVGVAGTCF